MAVTFLHLKKKYIFMNKEKTEFLEHFSRCGAIIKTACASAGISRQTYYNWMKTDKEFAERAKLIEDELVDVVQAKLLENIRNGDTTAAIFFLKTKGRNRGYGNPEAGDNDGAAADSGGRKAKADATAMKRVGGVKSVIIKTLKKLGKYSADMNYQIETTAQLLVRCDMLKQEIFDRSHSCVNVETSREGNVRESVSPRERLYMDYLKQCQYSLRALGMNTDSKDHGKGGTDGFDDFLNQFKNDK